MCFLHCVANQTVATSLFVRSCFTDYYDVFVRFSKREVYIFHLGHGFSSQGSQILFLFY
jgi:hypothetical protein